MSGSPFRFCLTPRWRCPYLAQWGGDTKDRRRYLCCLEDDGSGRHCREVKRDPEDEARVLALPGCDRARR